MKRKMIGAAAAYMAGLFFASFFTDSVLLLIFLIIFAAAMAAGRKYGFRLADYALMGGFFSAAVAAFTLYTALCFAPADKMSGRTGSFCGEVTDAAHFSGGYSAYILSGRIDGDTPAKVSFYVSETAAEYGDIISIGRCTFERPQNDYLFDAESFYRSDGVFLTVADAEEISVRHTDSKRLKRAVSTYRERIISDFRTALGGDSGDLLAGMVCGEKRGMEENVRTALYRCGTGHMLAVSGLHVSAAVLVLMGLLRLCRVNRYVSFALMELLLLFLTAMADYPVSAVRAAVMMNFIYAAGLFQRQNDTFNSLAGAVLLICIFQPYAVYDAGFVLSVAGTFGIGVFAPYMTRNMPHGTWFQKLILGGTAMLCTTLCVFPFSLLYFDEVSLISPITNIFIVPLCSASMVIGLLYALTGGAADLLFVSKAINDFVLRISDAAARSCFTHFSCGSRAVVGGLLVCAAAAALVTAVFRSRRFTAAAVSVSLMFMFVGAGIRQTERSGRVTVAVLGRGSNAAVVVCGGGSADVIDISGHYRSAEYVRKYLMQNGIERLGTVALSENVQSVYAAYDRELAFNDVGKWLAAGDNGIIGSGEAVVAFGSGFTVDSGSCSFSYSDGTLTVSGNGGRVYITDGKKAVYPDDGLNIVCRDSEESAGENVIFLNGNNNFEIVLSGDDSFEVRRL